MTVRSAVHILLAAACLGTPVSLVAQAPAAKKAFELLRAEDFALDGTLPSPVSVSAFNIFDNQHVNQIKTSNKNAPTTTVAGVKYQSGYGPLDQLQFNAPRSVQGTVAVRF